ncbi:M20 metallopeptidase family protein [Bifidobacterium tsurumiense]|uniref:M20 metallopeptidase family protein n=1 Tax=Bifidobacterium tsurumiense TaxID=356829 RepID=UPI0012B208E3|nr:amidohydrolase [Bifidobacterium tsurumiense]MDY4678059.1 amidohydrolase [Bifidobacterium tsurumiense]MSS12110.1 amidohydrolase [Bifidobacterium tsurumiense]
MTAHIEIDQQIVDLRHWLHAHPELGFQERETSRYIAHQLQTWGIPVVTTKLDTAVIADIQGELPGPRIALRADIDGLPIHEDSGLDFPSVNNGVMHGCGHDIHMSGLLAAARWLTSHRSHIQGSIRLVFQPSEETGEGARAVLDSGALEGVQAIIGTHNNPDYAPGQIAVGTEPMMAGCVKFAVTLHAQGTHAGYPHMGTGPIEALSSMILALQTIVSRNISPFHAVVLSVTQVHGGHVWNVVPAQAGCMGTIRFFSKADEDLVEKRFREQVEYTAKAYGIEADIDWQHVQIPLQGDAKLSRAVADEVPQYAQLEPIRPSMAGEDFAEYGTVMPLVFAFIGSNGAPDHHDWHSPRFVALDEAIQPTAEFYANAALRVAAELH